MTEPVWGDRATTEAGRLYTEGTLADALRRWGSGYTALTVILDIEHQARAEATAAAEQRLRERIEAQLAETQRLWEQAPTLDDDAMEYGRVAALKGVLALLDSDAPAPRETKEPLRCGNCGGPWHGALCSVPPAASPRQGEPVAVDIRRKPIPASVVRLMRIEDRPAGRGTIIVHEVDELHPITEACDICQLVTGARLSPDPAEPVAPDKEGNG